MRDDCKAEDWRSDAKCVGHDPELWFPQDAVEDQQAKAVCRECPVIQPCFEYAEEYHIGYGVWGGLDRQQRRNFRRRSHRKI